MNKRMLAAFVTVLVALMAASGAWAQSKRVALVIGNSAYRHVPALANPSNDAADMAATLTRLGFTVIEGRDLDKTGMDGLLQSFARALVGADVAVFYYAGHGLQVGNQNYLAPVDSRLSTVNALDFEMVRLDLVQRTMEREAKSSVLFLDACRDNPLARNLARAMGTRSSAIGRGLAAAESGVGTLISFATQPGNTASDGSGRNSPYTGALVKHLGSPGEDIFSVLIKVRNDVMAATNDRQIPWEHTALRTRLYFGSTPAAPDVAPPNDQLSAYDGVWEAKLAGNQFCRKRSATFRVMIIKGVVVSNHAERGKVEDDGSLNFKSHAGDDTSVTIQYEGQLNGQSGQGRYYAINLKCAGTATFRLMGTAAGPQPVAQQKPSQPAVQK